MKRIVHLLKFPFSNSKSIFNALEFIGYNVKIVNSKSELSSAKFLVIPGVGTFDQAMTFLKKNNYDKIIKEKISNKDKIICICLGMQILFEEGSENGPTKGLGIFKGKVKKLPNVNLGWKKVFLPEKKSFYAYFVHSYYVENKEQKFKKFYSYINNFKFCAGLSNQHLLATQFHPEKSGFVGLKLIKNFLSN